MARKPPTRFPHKPSVPADWLLTHDWLPENGWLSEKDTRPNPGLFWEDGQDGLELVNEHPKTPETGPGGPMEQDDTNPEKLMMDDPDQPASEIPGFSYGDSRAEEPGKPFPNHATPVDRLILDGNLTPYTEPLAPMAFETRFTPVPKSRRISDGSVMNDYHGKNRDFIEAGWEH